MFVFTTIAYPCVLAALCVGAGLLIDRVSGRFIPAVLLPVIGAATLIAVTQLTTYSPTTAPWTPYVIAVVAAVGFAIERRRVIASARLWRSRGWQLGLPLIVYAAALAPVLLAGRPSFSAFGLLTDSAFHMMGADFLIRHGQNFTHLDLSNSYGQYIQNYYGTGYPSGADTLLGGSAFVIGAPLIWVFQPFNAFMLAAASGPAWLLARRFGLRGAWAGLAALCATLSALVYAYELIGSIKEITALPLILGLGALTVLRERWLWRSPRGVVPFALLAAAGLSSLGVGFGAWVAVGALCLAAAFAAEVGRRRTRSGHPLLIAAVGAIVLLIAAAPTWLHFSNSFQGGTAIASTSNPGNLHAPLQLVQVFGTWLIGLYTRAPLGLESKATFVLIAVTLAAALIGAWHIVRIRDDALASLLALLLLLAGLLMLTTTTWIQAKTLMLTSPVVMLLAWAGIAAFLRAHDRPIAVLLAFAITAGVLGSDAIQYNATNLAPTARYQELGALDARYGGRGPTLFTDFDEYSIYELRDLDVGGPDFLFPPPALSKLVLGHGRPVDIDKIRPSILTRYPLIVTGVNPVASRPPAAYGLLWQGTYYQVWGRTPGAPTAIEHLGLDPGHPAPCDVFGRFAAVASRYGGHIAVAPAPKAVPITLANALPHGVFKAYKLDLTSGATVRVRFHVPFGGHWQLWLRGVDMPSTTVLIDGRSVGTIEGQIDGTGFNPGTLPPFPVVLSQGDHWLTFRPSASPLAPGASGEALLNGAYITPPGAQDEHDVTVVAPSQWRSLCGANYYWVEALPS